MAGAVRGICIAILAIVSFATESHVAAEDDPRMTVSLPPEVSADFLAEMRTHMANLDEIVAALAEDDFEEAVRIADIHMTFGHRRWIAMTEDGATQEEIASAKTQFEHKRASGAGQRGGGMGMGRGFGRFMPEDFRTMGASFHEAAEAFTKTTRSVATPAAPADYRAVLGALQDVTATCRACHDAFRIEVAR